MICYPTIFIIDYTNNSDAFACTDYKGGNVIKNATKGMLRRIVSAVLAVIIAASASVSVFAASDLKKQQQNPLRLQKKSDPNAMFCSIAFAGAAGSVFMIYAE